MIFSMYFFDIVNLRRGRNSKAAKMVKIMMAGEGVHWAYHIDQTQLLVQDHRHKHLLWQMKNHPLNFQAPVKPQKVSGTIFCHENYGSTPQ